MIINGGDNSTNLYIPPASNVGNDVGAFIYTTKAKWVCHGDHPCKNCYNMHGIVKTMEEWISSGFMPGWHKHCKCSLVAVDEPISSDHSTPSIIGYTGVTEGTDLGNPGLGNSGVGEGSSDPSDPIDNVWKFINGDE